MEWKPIETAPKDGRGIDLWFQGSFNGWRQASCWWADGKWHAVLPNWKLKNMLAQPIGFLAQPTHWMPLTEPPKEDAK